MESYKYNIEKRTSAPIVLEVAYIRDEAKIRYIVENAGASNLVRIEARLVGQSSWNLLLDMIGTDNQVVDVSTWEEVRVSVITYDSLSNYIDIIGSSFENVSISGGGGAVDSVNSQTGVVVIAAGNIPNTPAGNLSATNVQGALNELQSDVDTRALDSDLQDHITETVGAHAASAISNTPSGNLSATDVQSALNELDTEKMPLFDSSLYRVGPGRQYTTIQAALNAIGDSASAADVKLPKLVSIAGGVYDEDLTIPKGRILTLYVEGTVILGNGLGANWSSTNSRSVTFAANNADVFGSDIKPALNIIAAPGTDPTSTFIAESGTFRVSGALNVTGDGLSHTINLHNTEIDGPITKTATGLTNLQGYKLLVKGAVNMATATILERCYDCQFDALVTIDGYNAIINSEIKAGMTVTTNYNTLPPSGMFHTTFTGTFTGPANSLKIDGTTNYFFIANGASLAGGATKVILESIPGLNITNTPSGSISSTTIQAAINELDGDIQDHINDAVDAHDASSISNIPSGNLSAIEVQAALNELQSDIDTININGASYSDSFNATTDWTGPSGDLYSLTVPFSTHNKTNPIIQVFETNGAVFDMVSTGVTVDASYNVVLTVLSSPDNRFDGKLIIS